MATIEYTTRFSTIGEFSGNCPDAELSEGCHEGAQVALWDIQDRKEFLRLLAALERNRAAFLVELRAAQFVAAGGASGLPLTEFEELMFGPGSGGMRGNYADGFVSAFALLAPFVARLH